MAREAEYQAKVDALEAAEHGMLEETEENDKDEDKQETEEGEEPQEDEVE